MPVRIIGMIGVTPPSSTATVHVIQGGLSAAYLRDFCRVHEEADFDFVLVGYISSSAEGFAVATYASQHTERLGFLIAHRPGLVAPSLAARKIATLDHFCEGRLAIHIIAGLSDAEQRSEGDYLPKPERYERAREYLDIIRRLWRENQPFDHEGKHYRLARAFTEIKPYQKPHPPLFFGGSSNEAFEMGAEQCDVFAMYGEPLAETAERIADYRGRTAALGRKAAFNMSFRPVLAESEGAAWDKARRLLADIKAAAPIEPGTDASGRRLMEIASRGAVHDERLWMPIAEATGARGNTTCLVGTPEQVADAILKYYRLGVDSFLIRGFDPLEDARDYGRELIPRIRAGAASLDRRAAAE